MSALTIGLSGLLVNQKLLDLTGQNINNANTPDYHNQIAEVAEAIPTGGTADSVGNGVQVLDITRSVSQSLQQAVTANTSSSTSASAQLNGLNQLQSYLATGTGTLHDDLENFFNQLSTLTSEPSNTTQRQVVVAAANDVATQLNATVSNVNQMSSSLMTQVGSQVASVNALTAQIAQLNQAIHSGTLGKQDVNGLLDQRDQALDNLSQLVKVSTVTQGDGQVNVFANGSPLVLNNVASTLSVTTNIQGQMIINSNNSSQPVEISGGQIGGELALQNTTLPAVQAQLNTFGQGLASQFDQIQATGLGLGGSLTSLSSTRTVADTNAPLATQNLAFPAQAGDLYITVTNTATGQNTLNKVTINPSTQSLAGVASAISAVPNIQAVVNAQAGTINLIAKPGYTFNFSGNLSSSPDSQTITGTTVPTISGQYTGTTNDVYTYGFSGAGTIGVTPGLTMNVVNSAGTQVGSVNVGAGYSPGTPTTSVNGVSVNLTAGTIAAGDTFTVNVAGNPDSSNVLTALGLNSFFTGSSAGNLQLNPSLLNDAQQLATSTSGQPGDGSNLAKMVALQNTPVLAGGTQSLQQYLEGIIGSVGTQAANMQTSSTAYSALGTQLSDQLQSAVGVDPNAALMQLVQYQQAYQMSAQFVSVVDQTVQSLLNIIQSSPIG